jgi:ubiquinone/menaquinone biosynthesis C-methylase UbiE
MDTDTLFAGPVPQLYDQHLGPFMFEPYAAEIAERLDGSERDILETAAGTGIVTRAILARLPSSTVTATDLNQAMLDVAASTVSKGNVRWQQADAQALPFEDSSFDLVVCSFGVMFMPDKLAAYSEAKRVLRPGRRFLFTAWDRLEANPLSYNTNETVAAMFPDNPPQFMARTPFGHWDRSRLESDLRAAGFIHVEIEEVARESQIESATGPATGLTQGTPLRGEIEARDPGRLLEATQATAAALRQRFGEGSFRAPIQALMISASA